MTHDLILLGGSFSASLLARVTAAAGMRVLVLDTARHPRFAVGESSTPAADLLLADLAHRHRLDDILPLARFGSWRRTYPGIGCGKKRGFSYFHHRPHEPFDDTADHAASLLVAASSSDEESDTHWLRADVDAFLFDRAAAAGADCHQGCRDLDLAHDRTGWSIRFRDESGRLRTASAPRLVDGSGSGAALATRLALEPGPPLETVTGSVFGHFRGVASWDALQRRAGNASTIHPFPSDDAAQHHVCGAGWMWMLRFTGDLCSVGIVQPAAVLAAAADAGPDAAWRTLVADYPGLVELLAGSRPVRPLVVVPRLSRIWSEAAGDDWALLPTTAGFVDPLHSSGIAHGLSGVHRLADLLLAERHDPAAWRAYGRQVLDEIRWIDATVSSCYRALPDFELFCWACNHYFIAAHAFETAWTGGTPLAEIGFLAANDRPLRDAVAASAAALATLTATGRAADPIARHDWQMRTRDALAAWNQAGLMDPAAGNRYARTAVAKPQAGYQTR